MSGSVGGSAARDGSPRQGVPAKPSAAALAAAAGRHIPDVAAPGLAVLFVGINPSLYSAAVGCHFARPGNRFWPALHAAGLTPRLLAPHEQHELLALGLGVTNVVARATARADELAAEELRAGYAALVRKLRRLRPASVAFLGVTAYRLATGRSRAAVGRQTGALAGAAVWVLPNPSGLNAHYRLADLAREYAALRPSVELSARGRAGPRVRAPTSPSGAPATPP